jgi:hypothetical protein
MKKTVLTLVIFALVGFATVQANNATTLAESKLVANKAFIFEENGITFSVFQNGEFDFYLNQPTGVSINYQNNYTNISFNAGFNYNAYVQYDRYGAVIQIKNTPIFYDYYGRVRQIGNININYNNGQLIQLGGLYITYNQYGNYVYQKGYVNYYNRYYVYNPCHAYLTKPNYNYSVVSYKPYRYNYKEERYAYNNNHSKNENYYNNNAYNNKNKKNNQRMVTKDVPKRGNDYNTKQPANNYKPSNEKRNIQSANNQKVTRNEETTLVATISSRDIPQKEYNKNNNYRRTVN